MKCDEVVPSDVSDVLKFLGVIFFLLKTIFPILHVITAQNLAILSDREDRV